MTFYNNLSKSFLKLILAFSFFPVFPIYSFANESITNITIDDIKFPKNTIVPTYKDGRHYPIVPQDINLLASLIVKLEIVLRDTSTSSEFLPRLAHQQQVVYRFLSTNNNLSQEVLNILPNQWKSTVERHLAARREFLNMQSIKPLPTLMPAWKIVSPKPLNLLLSYYRKAEMNTGIDWEILAAINLVETGMGRIVGASSANALGPMQFLPTTWHEDGIGNGGDINDPHDSIQAAARYLVRRGALHDIRKGLWGYNNNYSYVNAVLLYAGLLKEDPRVIKALYHWEIHYRSIEGDLWLPVGYSHKKPIPISTYLKEVPSSAPPAYSSITSTKSSSG